MNSTQDPVRSGGLTASQIAWCDENLCISGAGEQKFKKWRLQAERARRETFASRERLELTLPWEKP